MLPKKAQHTPKRRGVPPFPSKKAPAVSPPPPKTLHFWGVTTEKTYSVGGTNMARGDTTPPYPPLTTPLPTAPHHAAYSQRHQLKLHLLHCPCLPMKSPCLLVMNRTILAKPHALPYLPCGVTCLSGRGGHCV